MRLLIVDDHEVVRRGVQSLLSSQAGYEVCGEAVDGQDALDKARELKPDLIVMDVSMPRLNGLEATRQLRSILPECEVLILSQHENSEMARQALKAGARGYVAKSSISRDLISAVAKAARREYFFESIVLDEAPSAHTDVQEILQRSAAFEKALAESEQRLRSLAQYQTAVMNNMGEGLYAVDSQGLLISVNRAGEAILGWSKDELVGRKMHDVTHYKHPDGSPYPASECPGLQVLQNGTTLRECEETFIRKDGSFLPVVFTASPLKEDGKITGVIVCFRNDTEQRRAREALLQAKRELEISADHLQLVTNSMAVAVTRCSQDLRYSWANQSYASWLSRPLEEIVGKPIVDVLGKKGFEKLLPYFRRVLAGERVSYEEEVFFESIGPRWISAVYTPTRNATGTPDGWIAAIVDITDRKRAEEEVRQSRKQLVLALEASKSALFEWDVVQRRGTWNPQMAALYGFQPRGESVTAEEWIALFHPDDVERLRQEAEHICREKDEFYFEFRTYPREGRINWVSSHGRIERDRNGQAVRMIGTHSDITDRKRAEEILKHSESRLRAAFSQTYSFLVLLQPDGTIIEVNRAALDAAGGDASRVVGRKFWELWWSSLPEEVATLTRIIPKVAAGQTVRGECHFCLPDGTRRVGDRTLNPVFNDQGHVVMIVAAGLDITERKQSEMAVATRGRQQQALFQLADELHRAASLEEVYSAGLNAILDALLCNRAAILLCDDAGVMRITSSRGLSTDYRAAVDGYPAWKPEEKNPQPVCIPDINSADLPEPLRTTAKREGIAALAFIPLIPKGKLQGRFTAYFDAPHGFSEDEIETASTIARQLAFAMERLDGDHALQQSKAELAQQAERFRSLSERLDSEVRARTRELESKNAALVSQSEQVRQLSQELLRAQDEERRHIARELHDSAGQTLTLLGMTVAQLVQQLQGAEGEVPNQAAELEQLVEQLHREIRTTSYLLHPPLLDESGLSSALNWYVQGLADRSKVSIRIDIPEDFGRLPGDVELTIFRLVQECLTNIHRHSGSKTALIRISRLAESVRVEVRDQGRGIAPELLAELQAGGSGVGIRGMQERLRQFGGEMKIESGGSGTCVIGNIPIPKQARSKHVESHPPSIAVPAGGSGHGFGR